MIKRTLFFFLCIIPTCLPRMYGMEKICRRGSYHLLGSSHPELTQNHEMTRYSYELRSTTELTPQNCLNEYWITIKNKENQADKDAVYQQIEYICSPQHNYPLARRAFAASVYAGCNTNEEKQFSKPPRVINRALYWASRKNDSSLVQLLFNHEAHPLAASSYIDDAGIIFDVTTVEIAQLFFKQDPSCIFVKNKAKSSVLSNACRKNYSSELVNWYIEKGLSVNQADIVGNTPFHKVCNLKPLNKKEYTNALAIFKLLLITGASLSAENHNKITPLEYLLQESNSKKVNADFATWQDRFKTTAHQLAYFLQALDSCFSNQECRFLTIPKAVVTQIIRNYVIFTDEIEYPDDLSDDISSSDDDTDSSDISDTSDLGNTAITNPPETPAIFKNPIEYDEDTSDDLDNSSDTESNSLCKQ